MAGDLMQTHAISQLCLYIREHSANDRAGRFFFRWCIFLWCAKKAGIDFTENGRPVIGGAAEHDAICKGQMRSRGSKVADPAIENNFKIGARRLELINPVIVERWHIAVLSRA